VLGELLREVSPGFLPRTLDQLRAGIENDARRPENILRRRRLTSEDERPEEPHQSLEDALDSLLDADTDDERLDHAEIRPAPITENQQDVTTADEPAGQITLRAQRAQERFARLFGSREDVQQDDYESPLSTMYNRAWNRYRQAEDLRATGDNIAPSLQGVTAQERRDIEEQLLWGVMRESQLDQENHESEDRVWSYTPVVVNDATAGSDAMNVAITPPWANVPTTRAASGNSMTAPIPRAASSSGGISEMRSSLQQITSELQRLRLASEAVASARQALHAQRLSEAQPQTLDSQPGRPPPKTDEEMTKVLACQVCYQQTADIALLPCGHMVMCLWCADVVIPVKHSHVPIRPSKCPMCRKVVKQRFRIHTG
jgi:hypothetical protein